MRGFTCCKDYFMMAHAESLNEAGGGEGSAYLGEIKK